MKAFAIITAALMATGGAVYFYTQSDCSQSRCTLPVAKSGGCCAPRTSCCPAHDDADAIEQVSRAIAVSAGGFKTGDCCGPKEECCLVKAACCTAEKATAAAAKPADIGGCCEACVTPTLQVTVAARSIAGAK